MMKITNEQFAQMCHVIYRISKDIPVDAPGYTDPITGEAMLDTSDKAREGASRIMAILGLDLADDKPREESPEWKAWYEGRLQAWAAGCRNREELDRITGPAPAKYTTN
jgi:hypothetical protein